MKYFVTGKGQKEGGGSLRGVIEAKIDSTQVANVGDLHIATCIFLAKNPVTWGPSLSKQQR
jgi:hypothetical protein